MRAYKGFKKDLTCLGFQFYEDRVNETAQANCRENGFHCAENPFDCLKYYPDWKNSRYYMVEAGGDLDEDGDDSKISCTRLRLIRELTLYELLAAGLVYMGKHPLRKWNGCVQKEEGEARNGYAVVRGKNPRARGEMGDILALCREEPDSSQVMEAGILVVDGNHIQSGTLYEVSGTKR